MSEALPLLQEAFLAIDELQSKLDAQHEPIAIVGIGCRFPGGVTGPDSFWRMMVEGRDTVTEVPGDRWDVDAYFDPDPDAPGKMYTRWGAFLDQVDGFEPSFFGLSPREVACMDPQHRLVLEVAWEALEDAGIDPDGLGGSRTGVFIGIMNNDYGRFSYQDAAIFDAHTAPGIYDSAVSGRLSYLLDLQGPSVSIDTACSSSLVTAHLACQALRNGECRLAIAGGVNLMLAPEPTIVSCRMRTMAPDGRCKTFDARANGYVRGEGCGMVVLKRLSDAIADGDRLWAVIRGSAVNQDGRTNGLTAPNLISQKAVIRQALGDAGVEPEQIGYVEAHGTGTSLGDPIEMEALREVVGVGGADHPCRVGTVKTNIGHLESAAGVAGLIKAALVLHHETIPPLLHLKTLNPNIRLEGSRLEIARTRTPWPRGQAPRFAGVSSFGFTGTNAHLVLAEAPLLPDPEGVPDRPLLLPISARSPEALRDGVQAFAALLADPESPPLPAIAWTAAIRRPHHPFRLGVVASEKATIAEALGTWLKGEPHEAVRSGEVLDAPRLVFVFPGQGSQWLGMARGLLGEAVFREALERCEQAFAPHITWRLLDELRAEATKSRLEAIDVLQPTLFAIQVALAALWGSWGIVPDAVIGHSMGEVAAAHVAGALTLEDAARIICRRSALLRRVSGQGAMAVVELSLVQAKEAISGVEDKLSIAVNNSPRSAVLSGDPAALAKVLEGLQAKGVFCRPVKVDVASHSPQMDPLREELLAALSGLAPRAPATPFYSTVTGKPVLTADQDATYWVDNLRKPVLFAGALERALAEGHALFLEISAHPILCGAVAECARSGQPCQAFPSLRREEPELATLLGSLAGLHAAGRAVAWNAVLPLVGMRPVTLPTNPWQRERLWVERPKSQNSRLPAGTHPLLATHLASSLDPGTHLWEAAISIASLPYLDDHRVQGTPLFPAAGFLEMARAAAACQLGSEEVVLEGLEFSQVLPVPEAEPRALQLALRWDDQQATLRFSTSGRGGWIRHASGRLRRTGGIERPEARSPEAVMGRCQELPGAVYYAQLAERGMEYGASFQGIERIWRGAGEALARVRTTPGVTADKAAYGLHPALLDACLQAIVAAVPDAAAASGEALLPIEVERFAVHGDPGAIAWSHATFREGEGDPIVDLALLDGTGGVLVTLTGVRARRVAPGAFLGDGEVAKLCYRLAWEPLPPGESPNSRPGIWLVFALPGAESQRLAELLGAAGQECIRVVPGDRFAEVSGGYQVDPSRPEDFEQLLKQAFPAGRTCRGILHLWGISDRPMLRTAWPSLDRAIMYGPQSAVALVQAVLAMGWPQVPRLWLVTRGVQPMDLPPEHASVGQATLWGLARVLVHEHPELRCVTVDLGAGGEDLEALCREALTDGPEDQLIFRNGTRYVARLERAPEAPGTRTAIGPDATYLVTGGLGGLGLVTARWLADQGARHLVLLGRSAPSNEARETIAALEARGVEVRALRADVADGQQLLQVLEGIDADLPPLKGVIHAAGILRDGLLIQMDAEQLRAVMMPKVRGAWNLHALTSGRSLDFFVLYSSAAGLIGSPGQANYAAANAFLDTLAEHRRSLGLPAVSIAWGPWGEIGLAAAQANRGERLEQRGVGSLAPDQGLAALGDLLGSSIAHVGVIPLSLPQWRRSYPKVAASPTWSRLAMTEEAAPARKQEAGFRERLLASVPEEQAALLEALVQSQLSQVLRVEASRIPPQKPMRDLGLDSLMAVELRNRLEEHLGLSLSATTAFSYPTVAELAAFLLESLGGTPPAAGPEVAPKVEPVLDTEDEDLVHQLVGALDQVSADDLARMLDP